MLVFYDTSTLVDHFLSSPGEREKRDRRDGRRDEREGQVRKRNRNETEETKEIKYTHTCYKDSRPCPAVSQYQSDTVAPTNHLDYEPMNRPDSKLEESI